MSKPEVGGGRVPIQLDGKEHFLEPSLEACIEVSRLAGGLGAAIERCRQMHFETICAIVGAGLRPNGKPLNPGQRDKMIPKAVYEAGVIGVMAACVEFVTVIMNAGRPIPDEPDEDAEQEGQDGDPLGLPH